MFLQQVAAAAAAVAASSWQRDSVNSFTMTTSRASAVIHTTHTHTHPSAMPSTRLGYPFLPFAWITATYSMRLGVGVDFHRITPCHGYIQREQTTCHSLSC